MIDLTPRTILAPCEHYSGSKRFIEKAFQLQEHFGPRLDVTCDAEDGAPIGGEREHLEMIVELLCSRVNSPHRCGVRIHDPASKCWQDEVNLLIDHAAHVVAYLTIPKARSLAAVLEVRDYISRRKRKRKVRRSIPLHVLIETPQALRDVWRIAALPEVEVLDFGLWDFIADHDGAIPADCMKSPRQFEHQLLVRAKTEIVAAAVAHGKVAAHNVTAAIDDPEQVYQDARRARTDFGFLRMWSIHPNQIESIIRAMELDFQELSKAIEILSLAAENNWGPVRYKTELHDRATYRSYLQLLKRAKLFGHPLPREAEQRFFDSKGELKIGNRSPQRKASTFAKATADKSLRSQ